MKAIQFASGLVSLLAVMSAVGCGAEQGQGPSENVGQTSAALSVASGSTLVAGTEYPGSCVIKDNGNTEQMLLFGGFNSSGTALDTIYTLVPGTGWSQVKDSGGASNLLLSQARGQLRGIQDPNDVHACWAVGGATTINGSAVAASGTHYVVEKIYADANGFHITHVDGSNHDFAQIARTRFELRACSSTNVIAAFGGVDNGGTYQNTVLSFDRSAPATAWASATTMNVARANFGLAQDGQNFVAGGGETSGGQTNGIDLLKTSSSCSSWAANVHSQNLSTGNRGGNAVVLRGTNQFAATAGTSNGIDGKGDTSIFTVDWTMTPAIYSSNPAAGTALNNNATTYLPMVVQVGTTGYVIGGTSTATGNTFATDAVQKSYWTSANLSSNGRTHGAAEYLPSQSKIYVTAGIEITGAGHTHTLLTSTDEITP